MSRVEHDHVAQIALERRLVNPRRQGRRSGNPPPPEWRFDVVDLASGAMIGSHKTFDEALAVYRQVCANIRADLDEP